MISLELWLVLIVVYVSLFIVFHCVRLCKLLYMPIRIKYVGSPIDYDSTEVLQVPTFSMIYFMGDLLHTFETSTQMQKMLKREQRIMTMLAILNRAPEVFGVQREHINFWTERFNRRVQDPAYLAERNRIVNNQAVVRNRPIAATNIPRHGDIIKSTDIANIDPLKLELEGEITKKVSAIPETRSFAFKVLLTIKQEIYADDELRLYKDAIVVGVKGSTAIYLLMKEKIENSNMSAEEKAMLVDLVKREFDGGDTDTSVYVDITKLPKFTGSIYYDCLVQRIVSIIDTILGDVVDMDNSKYCDLTNNFNIISNGQITSYTGSSAYSIELVPKSNTESIFRHVSNMKHGVLSSRNRLKFSLPNNNVSSFHLLRLKRAYKAAWDAYSSAIKSELFDISVPTVLDQCNKHPEWLEKPDTFSYTVASRV